MLILSRKTNESIIINDNIEIKIVEVNGEKIKLGISAPKDVKVLRSELTQTVESNKQSAEAISSGKLIDFVSKQKNK